jgi:hypothetical protein
MAESRRVRGHRGQSDGAAALAAGAFVNPARFEALQATVDRAFADAGLLRDMVQQYAKVNREFTKGRAFEFIEPLKFNIDAGLSGSDLRAAPTALGDPHAAADILITNRAGDVVQEVQAKAYGYPYLAAHQLAQPKYEGMARLVPTDQRDEVARHLKDNLAASPGREDAANHLTDRLSRDGISSGGTPAWEARLAAYSPHLETLVRVGPLALQEMAKAAAARAVAGGGIGLAFGGALNAIDVVRGKAMLHDAVIDTAYASASAAVRSGAVGAVGRGIAIIARQQGALQFAGGAGPFAIANGVLEGALSTRRFVRGEIDSATYRQELLYTSVKGSAAFFCGIAGNAVLPGVGGFVGAVVGYTTASVLLQAGLLGSGGHSELQAVRERQKLVEAETAQTVRRMKELVESIEVVAQADRRLKCNWTECLGGFEASMAVWDVDAALRSLAEVNMSFHASLPFRSFTEFDALMLDPAQQLPL